MTMYSCGSGAMLFQNKECTALIWRGQNKVNGGLAYKKKKFWVVLISLCLAFQIALYDDMHNKKAVNNSMVYTE